ncbi:MAG TPA: amidohydrolase family protein [Steroidobacteraceae bacterium]
MKALALFAVAAALTGFSAHAEDILIRNATVHTASSRGTLQHADVLIRDGRIAAVGSQLSAKGATVIEARNRPLTPGLFGGLTAIGLTEVPAEAQTNDAFITFGAPTWQQQWRPELDVTLAYNPASTVIPVTRIEGVTWAVLRPYSEAILEGQGAAVTFDGRYEAVLEGSRSLFVNWNVDAGGTGGSRAALYMLFDQAVREVREATQPGQIALLHPAGRESLARFLDGGRAVFRVDRATDIRRVVQFATRNGLKPVILGGAEAWRVAAELTHANVPVILDPLVNLPEDFERIGARLDNAARLRRAGVRIALLSGDIHNARKIRQLAGNAAANGLPWEDALAAITSAPAEIFGLASERGQIAVGQIADLVLWSGDPLEVTSIADRVWIAGRPVKMQSRQTLLRDRYFKGAPTHAHE